MATEFFVQHVTDGIISGPHRSRDVADREADKFRGECPCEGDPECGSDDTFPHGVNVAKSVDGRWSNDPDY
jgi:hypothetical protein